MNLENLYSFLTVALEGSISKASKKLHITQPTLSIRLRKLENELGFTLLDRNWSGIRLTDEGQYFAYVATQCVQDLNTAVSYFNQISQTTGSEISQILSEKRLIIGTEEMLVPFLIERVIPEIRRHFPELNCHYISRPLQPMLDLLGNGGMDVAIFIWQEEGPPVRSYPLAMDRLALFYDAAHYGEIEKDFSNAALFSDVPFVLCERYAMKIYDKLKLAWQAMFGQIPERFHLANEMSTLMGMLASGQGYSIMPALSGILLPQQYPRLRMVPLAETIEIPIHIAFSDSDAYATVIDYLKQILLDDRKFQMPGNI
ncbi:LysR family transcriptional regulator [Paenibacillus glycinis]|uniref:LysR family transcriptional regulator n=1 Tax=Paenibacillus glycinis TaxID=2697035 RepID=A0ABW9XKP0_9BACL|nr:LysR family transcriptional regulator [Paenibacillus glycinis]NBD23024.1 LysR family transcriptional regulator [Paenibacillus glycinis]